MTDIEGFLTIYGHSDNLLNNNFYCMTNNKTASNQLSMFKIPFGIYAGISEQKKKEMNF